MFSILCTRGNVMAFPACWRSGWQSPALAPGTHTQSHDAHAALQLAACEPQEKAVAWDTVVCQQGDEILALAHWSWCFFALRCPWRWYLGRGMGTCIDH